MELLTVVALILALGVGSRVLADRLQIPSVLFLIVAGVAIGPEGLGEVPTGDHELREGDRLTFIGQVDAVDRAIKRFHPHD